MTKIRTQGTDVYVHADNYIDKLACVTSISGLGGARSQIDVSCFSSDEMEYEGGMANPGQITFGGIYDSDDAVFATLIGLKESGEIVDWYIGGNDGTSAPTEVATVFTPPSDRTGIDFKGYVADISWQMDANSVWKYQLIVQRSGGWNLTPKA